MRHRFKYVLSLVLVFNSKYCLGNDSTNESKPGFNTDITADFINKVNQKEFEDSQTINKASHYSDDIKLYLDKIKEAVKNDDYLWFLKQIQYPVCFKIKNETTEIKSWKELLKYKNVIFTQDLKKIIMDQNREDIFSKDTGSMIENGEIWFDPGEIYTIQNDDFRISNCTTANIKHLPKKPPIHPYENLEGDWKLTDYQLRGVGAVDGDEADANMGKIASIRSNVITLNTFGRSFNCRIVPEPKKMKRDDFDFWRAELWGSGGGGLWAEDFNFDSEIYVYKTEPIGKSYELFQIVVDLQKQKMILTCAESGFYLFERIEKQ